MKLKVLVIDDEESIRRTFKLRLTQWGYKVLTASDGASGIRMLSEVDCHVVITDMRMPGLSGHEVVKRVREDHPEVKIVVITAYASVESAVEVMKAGAFDFITKPVNFDYLRIILNKIGEGFALRNENLQLRDRIRKLSSEVDRCYRLDNLVGKSEAMQSVFEQIRKVAPSESTVMVYGETGTGKEVVARAIHQNSPHKSGPMVVLDCGTLTETLLESELFGHEKGAFTGAQASVRGRFEQAQGGVIFLDEVSNASPAVQKKILRLIQEKAFQRIGGEILIKLDIRIIAATNQDLRRLVNEGKFRGDLFYRLNVLPIHLPPLRERGDDVLLLARFYLDEYARRMDQEPKEISLQAMKQLTSHSWPGNIRELFNVIERAVITTSGKVIQGFQIYEDRQPDQAPELTTPGLDPSLREQVATLERNYLKLALEKYHGRLWRVAERSGLNQRTLYRKMRLYELDKEDFR